MRGRGSWRTRRVSGVDPQGGVARALVYRELYNARHQSSLGMLEDLETCPGELSVIAMAGSQALNELDWLALRIMDEAPERLAEYAKDVASIDSVRAEAILHAWPPDWPLPDDAWTRPYKASWEGVERAMAGFRALGVTTSYDDVELAAQSAAVAGGLLPGEDDD